MKTINLMQRGFSSILLAGVVVLVAVAAGAYYFGMNNSNQNQPMTVTPSPSTSPASDQSPPIPTEVSDKGQFTSGSAEWKTYTNTASGFKIKYPSTTTGDFNGPWQFEERGNSVGFGTVSSRSGGYVWGIYVYDKGSLDYRSKEDLIPKTGSQFADRKEKREDFTLIGKPATLVTVTTASDPTWISKAVYLQDGDRLFVMSNGAVDSLEFVHFYTSFELTN